jgi:SAM-dependent methyltransferase
MNMWDERFDTPDYVYGTEPNHFLEEMIERIPLGPVLCVGEGEGRNAALLAAKGYDVTAVDASSVGLRKAAELAAARGISVETVHADLADYTIEPSHWAGIVSIFCHLPPPLRATVHRAVVDGLRPGGVFVLEAYSPRQLEYRTGGPPTLELLMDLDTIKNELAGLDFERAEELVRRIGEGRFHKGDGSVIQILGIKTEN